jgi:glycosyltransferase involved in cell wall biosynthesis
MRTILVIGSLPNSLVNFRGNLIKLLAKKNEVICIASGATKNEMSSIKSLGCSYIDIPLERNKLNPFSDIKYLINLYKVIKKTHPSIIISYTIKPVIWSGIASRLLRVEQFYPMITGLGYSLQGGNAGKFFLKILVKFLYKASIKNACKVIFQNKDNLNEFISHGIIEAHKGFLVNGSGVDISKFRYSKSISENHFLMISRLIGDKGIREYIRAARSVKKIYPNAIFDLIGPEDTSPDRITLKQLKVLNKDNVISYKGSANDVRPFIESCSVFVLPSYHEGMPRTVLEAMAMGRPILTTNVPGCRETVINGINGWLVEKENAEDLATKIFWFIENLDKLESFGRESNIIARKQFDVNKVNSDIFKLLRF